MITSYLAPEIPIAHLGTYLFPFLVPVHFIWLETGVPNLPYCRLPGPALGKSYITSSM